MGIFRLPARNARGADGGDGAVGRERNAGRGAGEGGRGRECVRMYVERQRDERGKEYLKKGLIPKV